MMDKWHNSRKADAQPPVIRANSNLVCASHSCFLRMMRVYKGEAGNVAARTRQTFYKPVTPGFTQAAVMQLIVISVESGADIETAINVLAEKPGSGLIIGPDPFTIVSIKWIAQLAAQKRLPAISVYRQFVLDGGLMAYGPDTADIFRRSATYIDRILKGEKPAELPVQQPSKFEFIVNLKTAQSFGLTMPRVLLSTADEVIE